MVIYCCITKYDKIIDLKIFIISQFVWIRNLDMAYLIEASVSRFAIKVPAGLQNSQGSAGEYPVPYSLS